jgi:competence protein ComEC
VLHREIPFLRIIIPLCSGIVAGLWIDPGPWFYYTSGAIILLLFILVRRFNNQLTNNYFGIVLSLSLFILGLALYSTEKKSIPDLPGGEAWYYGCLDDYPEEKDNNFRLLLKIDGKAGREEYKKLKGTILLYTKKCSLARHMLPGDRLAVRCSPIELKSRGNPEEFDYRFYMETRGIRYYAFIDSSDINGYKMPATRRLAHNALIVREKIIDMFRNRGISGQRLALVSAITLGQKSMLDQEQKQWFIKAGIMHIMAVSGLHAVILSLFIFKLLFFLKGRFRIVRILITIILLWAFAFITGLTPSVLRATIMFTFLQAGTLMKRPANGINSVLASAFVLILVRPSVIFDAGFLLSYAAVIYIICFYRDFYSKVRFRHKVADWVWQSAAVTIIAQAGTLPLTIMLFNRFPTWFILSNVIIVPVSSLVIIAGALVPLTYPVAFISGIVARILSFLTGLTETLTEKAANLPLATIENIGMTTIECLLLSVAIFLLTRFILVKRSMSPVYPLAAFLLFVFAGTFRVISTKATSQLIVYNTQGYYAVGIRDGQHLELYSDSSIIGPEIKRHCDVFNLKPELNLVDRVPALLKFKGNTIVLTDNLRQRMAQSENAGIMVLTGRHPKNVQIQEGSAGLKAIVVSPEAGAGFRLKSMPDHQLADTITYVRTDGSYILAL